MLNKNRAKGWCFIRCLYSTNCSLKLFSWVVTWRHYTKRFGWWNAVSTDFMSSAPGCRQGSVEDPRKTGKLSLGPPITLLRFIPPNRNSTWSWTIAYRRDRQTPPVPVWKRWRKTQYTDQRVSCLTDGIAKQPKAYYLCLDLGQIWPASFPEVVCCVGALFVAWWCWNTQRSRGRQQSSCSVSHITVKTLVKMA